MRDATGWQRGFVLSAKKTMLQSLRWCCSNSEFHISSDNKMPSHDTTLDWYGSSLKRKELDFVHTWASPSSSWDRITFHPRSVFAVAKDDWLKLFMYSERDIGLWLCRRFTFLSKIDSRRLDCSFSPWVGSCWYSFWTQSLNQSIIGLSIVCTRKASSSRSWSACRSGTNKWYSREVKRRNKNDLCSVEQSDMRNHMTSYRRSPTVLRPLNLEKVESDLVGPTELNLRFNVLL